MNEVIREHKNKCENWTGRLLEAAVIDCELDADTGECIRHDFGYDETSIVRNCEGCGEELERFYRLERV